MPKATDDRTPRVIGAGVGRTGTASLKRALEELGLGPCHHMEEVFRYPGDTPAWEAALAGQPVDWPAFLRGWGSVVDFPGALHYRALMAAFPDAKVILTVRDPEGWVKSFRETILPMIDRFPNRVVGPWLPRLNGPFRVAGRPALDQLFGGRIDDPAALAEWFVGYNAQVRAAVPAERLLVFDVREGWAPLCAFLGVPVPDGPFPRVNDTAQFQARTRLATALCWGVLAAPPVAAAALLAWGLG